jgi:hypothetical protein
LVRWKPSCARLNFSDDDSVANFVFVLPDLECDDDVDDEADDADETHHPIDLQRTLKFRVRNLSDADVVVDRLTTYVHFV